LVSRSVVQPQSASATAMQGKRRRIIGMMIEESHDADAPARGGKAVAICNSCHVDFQGTNVKCRYGNNTVDPTVLRDSS
jgi:hypothetical protein